MLIGRVEGATRTLGGSNANQPEYIGLPIRDEDTALGPVMVSAWFPTPVELEALKKGQPIYLYVFGRQHPPVSMQVPDSV